MNVFGVAPHVKKACRVISELLKFSPVVHTPKTNEADCAMTSVRVKEQVLKDRGTGRQRRRDSSHALYSPWLLECWVSGVVDIRLIQGATNVGIHDMKKTQHLYPIRRQE